MGAREANTVNVILPLAVVSYSIDWWTGSADLIYAGAMYLVVCAIVTKSRYLVCLSFVVCLLNMSVRILLGLAGLFGFCGLILHVVTVADAVYAKAVPDESEEIV